MKLTYIVNEYFLKHYRNAKEEIDQAKSQQLSNDQLQDNS